MESIAWKLGLTAALLAGIVISARARAPRRAMPSGDLHRLVASVVCLYVVGAVAWITHHLGLAVGVYAAGVAGAALAAWLSRAEDSQEPPRGGDDEPTDVPPGPEPDGLGFDWAAFERELAAYAERTRVCA
jgi:hypothetical protein